MEANKKMVNVKDIIRKYKERHDLIPALQDIQQTFGYLSQESLRLVSKHLDVPLVNIYAVATFYSMFKFKAKGKYHISICTGTACHVHNSDSLLEALQKKLKIKSGETSKDGKYSLAVVNCIGACAKAPAIMINDEVYGNLDENKLNKIIDGLK